MKYSLQFHFVIPEVATGLLVGLSFVHVVIST